MKKLFSKVAIAIVMILAMFNISMTDSQALGISGPSSVSPGQKFNVTVTGLSNIRGKFFVSVRNGSASTSAFFANGSSSQSITVTAGGSGSVSISVLPDTSTDTATLDGTLVTSGASKSVRIVSKSNNSNSSNNSSTSNNSGSSTQNTTPKKEDTRSKVNTLSSLTVSSGTLSPMFSSNKTSYTLNLTSEVESLEINAKATDSKAKVSGTGKKALKFGTQAFDITVTAENGSKKTYVINVNVEEKPTVFTQFGNQKLGILKNLSGVKAPNGYKSTNIQLEGQDVQAWTNEASTMTIAYLMNEKGEKTFYVVEDGKVIGQYQTITVLSKEYTLLTIPDSMKQQDGLKSSKVKIGDVEIEGWSFEDEKLHNYSVVYLMNEAGEKGLYVYEGTEDTLQKYTEPTQETPTMTYILIGTTTIFALGCAVLGYMLYSSKNKR